MSEGIVCFASAEHYIDHLAPLAAAIPGSQLLCDGQALAGYARFVLAEHAARGGWEGINAALADVQVGRPRQRDPRPLVVAAYRDRLSIPAGHRYALLEHGAGQTYQDGVKGAYYPGGHGWDTAELILAPGPHSARKWRHAYPNTPVVELGGTPRLDHWAALTEHGGNACRTQLGPDGTPVAVWGYRPATIGSASWDATHATALSTAWTAVSFHWPAQGPPEVGSTHARWANSVKRLAEQRLVLGHAHPRAWKGLAYWYQQQRIPAVQRFDEVLAKAWLYVCDNSSTMFEWAGLGRPVLCLNSPRYRREVEHGLRFWAHAPGLSCSESPLEDRVAAAWEDPPEAWELRERAVHEAYGGFFDGQATRRAVDAIREELL